MLVFLYDVINCDVINLINSHEILRYFFYILAKPLYVLAKILQNGAKFHEDFGKLQTSSGKFKQLKFDGLSLYKKYIPSAKTLYAEDLSNLLSTIVHQIPFVIFETISQFSWHSSSV